MTPGRPSAGGARGRAAMRIAFVVPRYGPAIIGGAETAARLLAEHLVARQGLGGRRPHHLRRGLRHLGRRVSRRARSGITGVRVVRFPSAAGREPVVPSVLGRRCSPTRRRASLGRCRAVARPPGSGRARALADAAAPLGCRRAWSSIRTSTTRRSGSSTGSAFPTILHPAAHDEPALHLPIFPRVFERGRRPGVPDRGRAAPRRGARSRWPATTNSSSAWAWTTRATGTAGGRATPDGHDRRDRGADSPMTGAPYLLCLGRVDGHKGTTLLVDYFARLQAAPTRARSDWCWPGPVVEAPPRPPGHRRARSGVRRRTSGRCSVGRPALVSPSAVGGVLAGGGRGMECGDAGAGQRRVRGHRRALPAVGWRADLRRVRRVRGGGRPSFRTTSTFGHRLGDRAGPMSTARFRWPRVIDRYAAFVESVVAQTAGSHDCPVAERAGARCEATHPGHRGRSRRRGATPGPAPGSHRCSGVGGHREGGAPRPVSAASPGRPGEATRMTAPEGPTAHRLGRSV